MKKIISIGEALIDFTPNQTGCLLKEVEAFTKSPGGAPANVAASVKALGGNAQMITKLGQDGFGDFLIETMNDAGIDTRSVYQKDKVGTGLAFIALKDDGEREFSFYRNPSADLLLEPEEIKEAWFEEGDILHFCSVDLVDAPVRRAHDRAIAIAKEKGCLISFDPNVRLALWEDHKVYAEVIRTYIKYADLLKVSDEELTFITGIEAEEEALAFLKAQVKVLIYTKGKEGARIITESCDLEDKGYPVSAIDTTGAGDAFIGAFIYGLLTKGINKQTIDTLEKEVLVEMLDRAQRVAAIVVTRRGAISVMPTLEEVEAHKKASNHSLNN